MQEENNLYIGRSNIPGSGKGLFTRELIKKDTVIIEYTGRITTWEQVRHDANNFYIYYVNDDFVIDAKHVPSALARYANDAQGLTKVKGLENNSSFVNVDNRIYIKATRNIPAHTEILVDYGEGYWETVKKNLRMPG